jgi:hypothetical protein
MDSIDKHEFKMMFLFWLFVVGAMVMSGCEVLPTPADKAKCETLCQGSGGMKTLIKEESVHHFKCNCMDGTRCVRVPEAESK